MRARLHLIGELHSGLRTPGAGISVKETAASLRLSPTPVREALARLTGDGLVVATEDRNGFAVPRLGPTDLVEAIEFACLLIGAAAPLPGIGPDETPEILSDLALQDAASMTEVLVSRLTNHCENRRIVRAIGLANVLLAPYRRVEPLVIPQRETGMIDFRNLIMDGRWQEALDEYRRIRVAGAVAITAAVDRSHRTADIFRI